MARGSGDGFVMVLAIVVVFLALAWYWRTPESAGGGYGACHHPCVEVTLPWAVQ